MDLEPSRGSSPNVSLASLIDRTAIAVTGAFLATASIGVALLVAAVALLLCMLAMRHQS